MGVLTRSTSLLKPIVHLPTRRSKRRQALSSTEEIELLQVTPPAKRLRTISDSADIPEFVVVSESSPCPSARDPPRDPPRMPQVERALTPKRPNVLSLSPLTPLQCNKGEEETNLAVLSPEATSLSGPNLSRLDPDINFLRPLAQATRSRSSTTAKRVPLSQLPFPTRSLSTSNDEQSTIISNIHDIQDELDMAVVENLLTIKDEVGYDV
ncbi:hypothetical protein DL96DRAFT_1710310 [Flagelloscypha sp. PMI_526]|nr:hypothetical protein DL96DRAFT_1710310 [Flagelloscypha sp. PMI_526]